MPMFDDKHVKIDNGIIVWDGITQPEAISQGENAGKLKWTLKVIFPPTCQDLQLFNNIVMQELQAGIWKGNLPPGGHMPIRPVGPQEYNGQYNGWFAINFSTMRNPQVVDENGATLDPMQYGQLIYTGQQVSVVAHAYSYDNKAKGVKAGLDGFGIITSANAPRQHFGGGGVDIASAFGGQQQFGVSPEMNALYGGQPAQHAQHQFGQPVQPQGGQPMQQPPQGVQMPNQQFAQFQSAQPQAPWVQNSVGNTQTGTTTPPSNPPQQQFGQQQQQFLPQQ